MNGEFELLVSERLLAELRRAPAHPKLRSHVSVEEAEAFVELLREGGMMARDATSPPRDDYLVALARSNAAVLVSGAQDLLELKEAPVESPRSFMSKLTAR